jgi:ABC-type phosphate transport system substrate-binding protein
VVVHPDNPVDNLTLEELRRLYLGRSTTFRDGTSVVLLELPGLRRVFYKAALGMAEDRVRRHWVTIAFQGELAIPPREVSPAAELRREVAATRGAIGFLAFADADESVKVLTIDGLHPGEAGYPLH